MPFAVSSHKLYVLTCITIFVHTLGFLSLLLFCKFVVIFSLLLRNTCRVYDFSFFCIVCLLQLLGANRRILGGFSAKATNRHVGFIMEADIMSTAPASLKKKTARELAAKYVYLPFPVLLPFYFP